MPPVLIKQVVSSSKSQRVAILQRADGLYVLELERFVSGDPLLDVPGYWSPVHRPVVVTDRLADAERQAREELRMSVSDEE